MQTSDDLTNVVARIAADAAVETVKSSKEILMNTAGAASKLTGKNNLNKLLKSEKELKMSDIKLEDLKVFAKKAKAFGLAFAVIKDGDTRHIVYKADDMERAKKVFEISLANKLNRQNQRAELDKQQDKAKIDREDKKLAISDNKKVFESVPSKNKDKVTVPTIVKPEPVKKEKPIVTKELNETVSRKLKEIKHTRENSINNLRYTTVLGENEKIITKDLKMSVRKSLALIKENKQNIVKDQSIGDNLIEKKLQKEQQPVSKKEIDIANESIKVADHNNKNVVNSRENTQVKESIRVKLDKIAQTNIKINRVKIPSMNKAKER